MKKENAIETVQLSKSFRSNHAVKNLTFAVPTGSIFALLGANGAGKSTTMRLLLNIIQPTSGTSSVLGCESKKIDHKILAKIGYVSEATELPLWMSVKQYLDYLKPFYPTWDDELCAHLIERFELPPATKLKHLSRGMRMKALLLSCLAYRPSLILLDEPFSGLDPVAREDFIRGTLSLVGQEDLTILISSHDIDEVERLCDYVGFINKGELLFSETISSLIGRFRKVQLQVESEEQLPEALPTNWLQLERANRRVVFVDQAYKEQECEALILETIPSATNISTSALSLKEIFIAISRNSGKTRINASTIEAKE